MTGPPGGDRSAAPGGPPGGSTGGPPGGSTGGPAGGSTGGPAGTPARVPSTPGPVLRSRSRGLLTVGQVIRATVAATVAFLLATELASSGGGGFPVLAPITALMVVQPSAYATFGVALQRIVATAAGVALAVVLVSLLGVGWWSFALAVLAALLLARRLPFSAGGQMQLPVAVLFVVAVGGTSWTADVMRIVDVVIGGATGLAALLLPPARPPVALAQRAQDRLATALAAQLRTMAAAVAAGPVSVPGHRYAFVTSSRGLREDILAVAEADSQIAEAQRLSLRSRQRSQQVDRLQRRYRWLSALTLQVRSLAGTLDRLYAPAADVALARSDAAALLTGLAGLLEVAYGSGNPTARRQGEVLTAAVQQRVSVLASRAEAAAILDSLGVLARVHALIGLLVDDPVHGEALSRDLDAGEDGPEGPVGAGAAPAW